MSVDPRRSRCPSMSTGSRARRSLFRTASPSPSDGPDRRRLQLVRRANRDSQPDPEGPLRGGAGSRRVVLHARQRHAGPDPASADHRHLPYSPLRPVCHRGLGKPALPHPARRLRRHRPRHPPLVGLHPAVRHRPAYGADLFLRVVQAPARAQLGDRRRPVRSGASDGDHRRLSSMVPGRLLDRRGGDQHCRLHALHRLLPPCALAWRRYRRADDAEPNLRHPCLAHTRHPVPTDRRPPGAAPQARRIRFLRQLSRRLSKPRRRRRPPGTDAAPDRAALPLRTTGGHGPRRVRRALRRHPDLARDGPAVQPMSTLIALIGPALHLLAAELPSQAPQGNNRLAAQAVIGSLFSLHILIAGLVSGAGEIGPAIEFLGFVRQRRRYDRLAHGLGRFMTLYFSFSSAIAILLITVLLVGYWGHFWTTMVTIGWWPLFIEAWTFVLQVSLAYIWYYAWEPLRAFKGVHMAIGGLLAIASFLQVYMIDIIASYMLTPTNPQNPLRLALNPTSYPLTVHRTIGNLAYIGFAFGAFCAIRFLRARNREDKAFYDWAGSFGVLWGVAMTLLQPIVGYSYAKEIQLHSYGSWYKMMFGTLSPVFLWQITLLGIMFITATLYFGRRLRTDGARGSGLLRAMSVGLVLTTLLAAMPYHLGFTYADVAAP